MTTFGTSNLGFLVGFFWCFVCLFFDLVWLVCFCCFCLVVCLVLALFCFVLFCFPLMFTACNCRKTYQPSLRERGSVLAPILCSFLKQTSLQTLLVFPLFIIMTGGSQLAISTEGSLDAVLVGSSHSLQVLHNTDSLSDSVQVCFLSVFL